jgi:hypothetical protein
MPHLTNTEYYKRYRLLNHLWQHFQDLYALLDPDEQYAIHNFYQPDRYTLSKADLIQLRKDIQATDRGLSARAARAYIKIAQAYRVVIEDNKKKDRKAAKVKPAKRRKLKGVSVRAVVRPEPDWDKFAYALLQYAKTIRAAEEGKSTLSEPTGQPTSKEPRLYLKTDEERHAYAVLMLEKVKRETADKSRGTAVKRKSTDQLAAIKRRKQGSGPEQLSLAL